MKRILGKGVTPIDKNSYKQKTVIYNHMTAWIANLHEALCEICKNQQKQTMS